ncbi:hypothetical protein C8Q74DRAFT_1247039 [Fomes fomentarius]|nr:hypothetical protein C8Q74DRAFT_1247039 [Fomes fomentarius]
MKAVVSASQAARRDIEDDIERHAWAIINLKRRLNTLTLFAGLPTELLSEIFLHLARDSYENHQQSTYPLRSLRWIMVTHICHSWREVALNSPRLWGYIVLTHPPFVNEFLARSKSAPLWITAALLSSGDEKFKVLEEVLHGESQRLAELRLSGPIRTLLDACQKLGQSATLLETLVLSKHPIPSADTLDSTHIPHTMFSLSLPHLRAVEIRRLGISWDHPIFFANLTRLIIHGRPIGQDLIGTFECFLSVLERMPDLQVLDLEDTIPPTPAENTESLPPVSRKVTLPHLRHISLVSTHLECANLLNHLTLPKDARLHLVGRCSKADRQDLIEVVKEHLSRSLPLQTLRFERNSPYSSNRVLDGWRALVDLDEDGFPSKPLDSHLHLDVPRGALDLMSNTTAFANIQRLDVGPWLYDWEWKPLFMGIPNIRMLSLRGDLRDDFAEAFSYVLSGHSKPAMVFPSLEVLKLRSTHLKLTAQVDEDTGTEFLDLLVDCLIKRCNYGVPVQELYLTCCDNTFKEDVRRLEEVVPDVKWDGIENEEAEESEDEVDYPDYDVDYELDFEDLNLW